MMGRVTFVNHLREQIASVEPKVYSPSEAIDLLAREFNEEVMSVIDL